jgi:hypothetical protein
MIATKSLQSGLPHPVCLRSLRGSPMLGKRKELPRNRPPERKTKRRMRMRRKMTLIQKYDGKRN